MSHPDTIDRNLMGEIASNWADYAVIALFPKNTGQPPRFLMAAGGPVYETNPPYPPREFADMLVFMRPIPTPAAAAGGDEAAAGDDDPGFYYPGPHGWERICW